MEASALTHAQRQPSRLIRGLSPTLRLQKDERLIAMIRAGNAAAFETLFERYQARLLGFCRHMVRSQEDAEDVLQEVFVAAYKAMLADERPINARPWLYRIARNRCLNHLRRPVPDGQDSMDVLPHENGTTTADRVHQREEFRQLIADVGHLPETQRTALLLREVDILSYEDIAAAMETTVPSVKSLLVRARIALAESAQARQLTCDEVRVQLAEASEGMAKLDAVARRHVKTCDGCRDFRKQLRADHKALVALLPIGPVLLFQKFLLAKLSWGAAAGGSSAAGGGAAAGTAASGALGGGAAATGAAAGGAAAGAAATGAAGGIGAAATGAIGGAVGAKAAAGVATAALLTAGAVEVKQNVTATPAPAPKAATATPGVAPAPAVTTADPRSETTATTATTESAVAADPKTSTTEAPPTATTTAPATTEPAPVATTKDPASEHKAPPTTTAPPSHSAPGDPAAENPVITAPPAGDPGVGSGSPGPGK